MAHRNVASIYIHIPYCAAKCPYCDFNSYASREWPEDDYADALVAELQARAAEAPWSGATIETIFFGGGTPSLFQATTIGRILEAIALHWPVAADVEVTLEANPGSTERSRLRDFRGAGINRLSLGIQSLHAPLLTTLGRIHSAEDARTAIETARAAGFDNLNLDLMFAIPGQTREQWSDDVRELLAHAPEHVAAYNLTYEPQTPFHAWRANGELRPLEEDDELWMYEHVRAACASLGYEQYEISNFARPGHAARHNRGYWQGRNYLGVGAGAHSYASHPGWGRRWSNERLPERYITRATAGDATAMSEDLAFDTAAAEFMFLGLRELAGVDPNAFRIRFGQDLEQVHPEVPVFLADGLLEHRAGRLALTNRGLLVADAIFTAFV